MDIEKKLIGWNCTLTPEEVEHAKNDQILKQYLGKWKIRSDGTATLRVLSPLQESLLVMALFVEGLGEGMYPTNYVERVREVEIEHREY